MKENLVWSKTLLSVYRYLERLCGAIDKIVRKTAFSGANVNSQTFYFSNVYTISQRIIDLSDRKVTLINLKLLIEDALKKMNSEDAKILIERYLDGTKRRVLAEKQGVSIRTVFRQIEKAEISFNKNLLCMGYSPTRLEKMLCNETWIKSVYDRISKKDEDDFSLSNCYIEKAASM